MRLDNSHLAPAEAADRIAQHLRISEHLWGHRPRSGAAGDRDQAAVDR